MRVVLDGEVGGGRVILPERANAVSWQKAAANEPAADRDVEQPVRRLVEGERGSQHFDGFPVNRDARVRQGIADRGEVTGRFVERHSGMDMRDHGEGGIDRLAMTVRRGDLDEGSEQRPAARDAIRRCGRGRWHR